MPAFHYIALNQTQQELSGVIEAPDEPSAREKLNSLGLSVISINAAGVTPDTAVSGQTGKITFEFESFDKNGKKIVGTIVSDDALKAYARLFDEYQLDVISLFAASLNPKDKEEARMRGIGSLREQYQKLYGLSKIKKSEDKELTETHQKAKKELIEKVDFTIKTIEAFLQQYMPELKQEQRETIQSYINQLLRIKDSTNLEHIRTTCERMLKHIQDQELFIHEEQRYKESSKVKIETKELLDQLKQTGLHKEINIIKIALDWRKYPVLNLISKIILKLFSSENPAIRTLKDQISVINRHIFSYLKIIILGKSKILRVEALESIRTLRAEKKRLKLEIKAIKMGESKTKIEIAAKKHFLENAASVSGWILAFYLLSYFAAYPLTTKDFGIKPLPNNLYFYSSSFTKTATIFFFITYIAIQIRNFWLKRNIGLSYVVYFIGFLSFLLIFINLM